MNVQLTPSMKRELRAIDSTGEVGDLMDYGTNALAFYAREKTIEGLKRRELIRADFGGFVLTDAGHAAIRSITSNTGG